MRRNVLNRFERQHAPRWIIRVADDRKRSIVLIDRLNKRIYIQCKIIPQRNSNPFCICCSRIDSIHGERRRWIDNLMRFVSAKCMKYLLYDFTGAVSYDDVFLTISIGVPDLLAEQMVFLIGIACKSNTRQA